MPRFIKKKMFSWDVKKRCRLSSGTSNAIYIWRSLIAASSCLLSVTADFLKSLNIASFVPFNHCFCGRLTWLVIALVVIFTKKHYIILPNGIILNRHLIVVIKWTVFFQPRAEQMQKNLFLELVSFFWNRSVWQNLAKNAVGSMADSFRVIWSKSLILFKSRPKTAKRCLVDLFFGKFSGLHFGLFFPKN